MMRALYESIVGRIREVATGQSWEGGLQVALWNGQLGVEDRELPYQFRPTVFVEFGNESYTSEGMGSQHCTLSVSLHVVVKGFGERPWDALGIADVIGNGVHLFSPKAHWGPLMRVSAESDTDYDQLYHRIVSYEVAGYHDGAVDAMGISQGPHGLEVVRGCE